MNEDTPAHTESTPLLILPTMPITLCSVTAPKSVPKRHMASVRDSACGLRILPIGAPGPSKDQIERPCPAVTPVGRTHRGDLAGVPRGGQPIADRTADRTPANRHAVALRRLAGDQEHEARAGRDCIAEPPVEEGVRGGEA